MNVRWIFVLMSGNEFQINYLKVKFVDFSSSFQFHFVYFQNKVVNISFLLFRVETPN